MLPSYSNSASNYTSHSNIDIMKNYDSPYASGFHPAPLYPSYENLPPPPPPQSMTTQNNLISIKSEIEPENVAEPIDRQYSDHIKHSPVASDRSESNSSTSSTSLKIDDSKHMSQTDSLLDIDVHDQLKPPTNSIYGTIKSEQQSSE